MSSIKPIQQMIDDALAQSSVDACIVIGTEHTTSNLRFAANGLTTNGQMTDRSLTMISILGTGDATQAGVVTRTVTTDDELAALVAASEQAAREAGPADDAFDLVDAYPNDDDWDAPSPATGVEIFADFAPALGVAFARMAAEDELLYGFAEHELSSIWLASSTGLRRRFDQPDGRLELNAKSADLTRSAWAGVHTTDFGDVDVGSSAKRNIEITVDAGYRISGASGAGTAAPFTLELRNCDSFAPPPGHCSLRETFAPTAARPGSAAFRVSPRRCI